MSLPSRRRLSRCHAVSKAQNVVATLSERGAIETGGLFPDIGANRLCDITALPPAISAIK